MSSEELRDLLKQLESLIDQTNQQIRRYFLGKEAYKAAIGGLWSQIKGMSHSISGAWSTSGDQVGVSEATVMYTRKNDTLFTIKACTVLRRRGGKVADIRIHADVNGL